MTQRSQHRTHLGKRGAAQRRARREGYAAARDVPCIADDTLSFELASFPRSPHLAAAFRRGALDFANKHGGRG